MGFITSISTETLLSATFYTKVISVTNGIPAAETWTTGVTVDCLFWTGSSGLSLVNDKLKTMVDGAIAVDYNSTIAAMGDDNKFVIGSKNYRILHVENVGEQNEMLQIFYKRELSN